MDLFTFILGIAILILVHELGHFVAARLLKVEVEEFGIGFPPRLAGTARDIGRETPVVWLKPAGEPCPRANHPLPELDPAGWFCPPQGRERSHCQGGLAAASPWVRLGVLFAGPAIICWSA